MRLAPAAFATALLGGLTACATAGLHPGARSQALLSDAPPPAGRQCHLVPAPDFPVHVDLVVDSVGLVHDLRTVGEEMPRGGYVILSLQVDAEGQNAWREVIESDLPRETADSVQARVFNRLRRLQPGEPWGARLRVDLDGHVRLRVGRQELCPARLRSPTDRVGGLDLFDVRSSGRVADPAALTTVWFRVDVAPSGVVTDVRMQPPLVPWRLEIPLLSFVRALPFDPAILDGIPISSSTLVPVRLR